MQQRLRRFARWTTTVLCTGLMVSAAGAKVTRSERGRDASGQSAGDVNGDGYDDVVVGASGYDARQRDEGAVFVYLGGPRGIAHEAATTLLGDQPGSRFGGSVAPAGDVNGDGYADLVVGASSYDASSGNEGAAFVFLGGPDGIASGSPATASAVLRCDQPDAEFGSAVSGAGDVNGDGYADVVVCARSYDAGAEDDGAAFVYLGGPNGVASSNPMTAATTIRGSRANAHLERAASVGDWNGDGYGDVAVGVRSSDASFVFLGSPEGVASGSIATAAAVLDE